MAIWGYANSECPPENWPEQYPEGAGSSQSPVDIRGASFKPDLRPISIDYHDENAQNIVNNGHSIQVNFTSGSIIQGAHLETIYELIQFHFHWGGDCGAGAEHLINGKSADAELHFVHKRKDCENPTGDSKGLAVLGVRLIIDDEKATGCLDVTKLFSKCENVGETYPIESLNFAKMVPDLSRFYTYQGSLTTPPLSECVCWIVCDEPVYITSEEMACFRSLTDSSGKSLSDNYRPVMPLNDRQLNANFE